MVTCPPKSQIGCLVSLPIWDKKNCPLKNQKLSSLTLGLLAVRKAIHTEGLRACGDVHLMDQSGYGYMRR